MNKRKRIKSGIKPGTTGVSTNNEIEGIMPNNSWLLTLSLEILCHILDYLPLKDVMKMDHKSKKLHEAVSLHLRVRKKIDFTENEVFGWMSDKITDKTFTNFLIRCRDVEYINGLHVPYIAKRRTRGLDSLSVPGVTEALALCSNLKGIEISDIYLLEAVLAYLPEVEILGTFKNRIGNFPFDDANKLRLSENPRITSLHLVGVCIPDLPPLMFLKHLQLRWVHLSGQHPFMDFAAPQLQTFVMAHCGGPANSNPLKYVRLIASLATSQNLKRLELIRVPILGGLIQHVVEDSWRIEGFKKINHLKFGACKFILEMDVGYMVITAAPNIEELCLQPSLTKDSLFISLRLADVSFKFLQALQLGFVDAFPEPGQWTNEDLAGEHLSDVTEHPAMVTDVGMKSVGQCFLKLKRLQIFNCPHIHNSTNWLITGTEVWSHLKELYLRRCHAVRLADFCLFIEQLPNLELLHLEHMFREPPKGCSRVGLSAGTGLGMSSALVGNHHGSNVSNIVDASDDSDNENDNNNNELVPEDDQEDVENLPTNRENAIRLPNEPNSDLVVEDNNVTNPEISQNNQTLDKTDSCEGIETEGSASCTAEPGSAVVAQVLPIQSTTSNASTESAPHEATDSQTTEQSASSQLLLRGSNEVSLPFSSDLLSHDFASSNQRQSGVSHDKASSNQESTGISHDIASSNQILSGVSHDFALPNQRSDISEISHDKIFIQGEKDTCLQDQKFCGVSEESKTMLSVCESSYSKNKIDEAMSKMKAEHEIELEAERLEVIDEDDPFLLHGEDMADDTWSDEEQNSDSQESGVNKPDRKSRNISDKPTHDVYSSQGSVVQGKKHRDRTDPQMDSQNVATPNNRVVNMESHQEEQKRSSSNIGKQKDSSISKSVEKMDISENLTSANNEIVSECSVEVKQETEAMNTVETSSVRIGTSSHHSVSGVSSTEDNKMGNSDGKSGVLTNQSGVKCCKSQADNVTSCTEIQEQCCGRWSREEQNESEVKNQGQGHCKSDSQVQIQVENKGQGQHQCDVKGQGQKETFCGVATSSREVTTSGAVVTDKKDHKQLTIDSESMHSSLENKMRHCSNSDKDESCQGKKEEKDDEHDDEEEEEEEYEDYSDEDELDEETVLIVRREEPRGYKVTSEKVNRSEKVIQENNITLSGEISVRSESGEITIDPTQGQMSGIVSNVVIMLGMTMSRPKATGTRQLGRDIVVTISGRSTYVGSGEIDVSIVNGKKIIAILQTKLPRGPCETLSDVLRNCGLPSILHIITEGDIRKISLEQRQASNLGETSAQVLASTVKSGENLAHEESIEHLEVKGESVSKEENEESMEFGDKKNEGHKERSNTQDKLMEENEEKMTNENKICSQVKHQTKKTVDIAEVSGRHIDVNMSNNARSDKVALDKSSSIKSDSGTDNIECTNIQDDQTVDSKSKSSGQVQTCHQDMEICKSTESEQASNLDMVIRKSPGQDQTANQDVGTSKDPQLDQAPNQVMIATKSSLQEQASNKNIVKSESREKDLESSKDLVRSTSPEKEQAPDQDMIRCDCPVRGILHTCSGMVVLLSPCCQMYGNMRIRDSQVSPPIPPSAMGAFWSCTVDDPGPSTVADPKLAITKVDNSIQRGQDNDKACQTRATASQSDPSNQVISCLSMGGPSTHNSVGVATISNSRPPTHNYVNGKRMIDQATCTRDPVIEDDHKQVLEVKSKSLLCLSLNMVGITDLVFTDCPNLTRITGCACRVLKKVKTVSIPKLQKISFAQCRKLDEDSLIDEITSLSTVKNRLVYLRPLHQFDRAYMEKHLFGGQDVDYGLCVVYDYNPSPQDSMYNRTRVASWPNLFIGINLELLQSYNFRRLDGVVSTRTPLDRIVYSMAGENENGSKWELITDIPWLRPLSECPDLSESKLSTQDKKAGVYCPAAKGHFSVTDCLVDLQNDIAEKQATGIGLMAYSIIVYINMCDISGVPVHDPYL
ncbi:uro-adherence factor A-like [Argopecten irradians]|uniref:uro-adherence factor A-like n=1 Tax=Argopecten irradians TaxID=31199 RepID=UPI003711AAD4